MIAKISKNGILTILAENTTEEYALEQWKNKNYIKQKDEIRLEEGHYRKSSLAILNLTCV